MAYLKIDCEGGWAESFHFVLNWTVLMDKFQPSEPQVWNPAVKGLLLKE